MGKNVLCHVPHYWANRVNNPFLVCFYFLVCFLYIPAGKAPVLKVLFAIEKCVLFRLKNEAVYYVITKVSLSSVLWSTIISIHVLRLFLPTFHITLMV